MSKLLPAVRSTNDKLSEIDKLSRSHLEQLGHEVEIERKNNRFAKALQIMQQQEKYPDAVLSKESKALLEEQFPADVSKRQPANDTDAKIRLVSIGEEGDARTAALKLFINTFHISPVDSEAIMRGLELEDAELMNDVGYKVFLDHASKIRQSIENEFGNGNVTLGAIVEHLLGIIKRYNHNPYNASFPRTTHSSASLPFEKGDDEGFESRFDPPDTPIMAMPVTNTPPPRARKLPSSSSSKSTKGFLSPDGNPISPSDMDEIEKRIAECRNGKEAYDIYATYIFEHYDTMKHNQKFFTKSKNVARSKTIQQSRQSVFDAYRAFKDALGKAGEKRQMLEESRAEKGIQLHGTGVTTSNKFIIDTKNLDENNILAVRYKSSRKYKLPPTRISNSAKGIVHSMLHGKKINNKKFSALPAQEQSLLELFAHSLALPQKPTSKATQDLFERFQILQGEIEAGNDSAAVLREYKQRIAQMVTLGVLSRSKGDLLLRTVV